ncbi:glycosyl hydrolase family 5 [Siccirubricoccus deserti]|uniref:cellulase n=2 Tax=Siccirubricoccus deserti TaxID=2013562 RepID=A0A9X0QVB2_9PROT|nr:glycosyl hydrolase family 5 [Siccirubricoccus deserti]
MPLPMSRRSLAALLPLAFAAPAAAGRHDPEWIGFRQRFMAPEGRVVDTGNGNVSHTEGQGWALLFAVHFDDRASFDRILGWTRRNLQRRGDALFSWRWRPNVAQPVDDPNNATDGDIYIAWALLRGAARWGDPGLRALAVAIGRDLLRLLWRDVAGQGVLLPGLNGFETATQVVVNPSYFVFPAYAALAEAVPDPRWQRLTTDALAVLRVARFGRWGLPPDWLSLPRAGGRPDLPTRWPPRFSFDAVRVPLLLAWGGHATEPAVGAAGAFWAAPTMPAWADLRTDAVAEYPASGGVRAIAALVGNARPVPLPPVRGAADYYAASLGLLVALACADRGLPTVLSPA